MKFSPAIFLKPDITVSSFMNLSIIGAVGADSTTV